METALLKSIVVATNSQAKLEANLLRSPDVQSGQLTVVREQGHASAAGAYNAGLERCEGPCVAFVHQDVYLPAQWLSKVNDQLQALERRDPQWAVAGVWGVCGDGTFAGRVWCTGGRCEHIGRYDDVCEVASVDEIVILLNTRHGIRFDTSLPGYHLYATDLIQQARSQGLKAYVLQAPVVHNSRPNFQPLDKYYIAGYIYMQRKWREQLPLSTAVLPVTRWGGPLLKKWIRNEIKKRRFRPSATASIDARQKAQELGYESGQ